MLWYYKKRMSPVSSKTSAISPKREENFPEWYQQAVKAADMAENSPVRGCMVIKPWGFGIWEKIQRLLDARIKATGHENVYFPLFIPLSYLEKEAEHVEGFAKECAVVTHHRLQEKDGKLIPSGELEEPLIIRPTSETIVGEAFSRWIESYRDLPLLINQWANIVRWEMRPRIFLRTSEFLWQEGHTAHATEQEAKEETLRMLEVYRWLIEDNLAIPAFIGEKSPGERFPGAVTTYTLEAMMQDRKALQGGTSHYLGQNFSQAQKIQFTDQEGRLQYAYTSSWGVTTRLIGAMIMVHGDDDGIRIPPRVASKHIVILPVIPKPDDQKQVLAYADLIAKELRECSYHGEKLSVIIDDRDKRGGEKNWDWIKKGIPLRIEVGPRDVVSKTGMVSRRDKTPKDKESIALNQLGQRAAALLDEIQNAYYTQAAEYRQAYTKEICSLDELKEFFKTKNSDQPEIHGGFVKAKWCEDPKTEKLLDPLKLTIRCLPLEQSGNCGKCILTGKEATKDVLIAKAY